MPPGRPARGGRVGRRAGRGPAAQAGARSGGRDLFSQVHFDLVGGWYPSVAIPYLRSVTHFKF